MLLPPFQTKARWTSRASSSTAVTRPTSTGRRMPTPTSASVLPPSSPSSPTPPSYRRRWSKGRRDAPGKCGRGLASRCVGSGTPRRNTMKNGRPHRERHRQWGRERRAERWLERRRGGRRIHPSRSLPPRSLPSRRHRRHLCNKSTESLCPFRLNISGMPASLVYELSFVGVGS